MNPQGLSTTRPFTGIVAALVDEARCLVQVRPRVDATANLPDGSLLRLSGMGPVRSAKAAQSLVDEGAAALLSWGVCGALDPRLKAGSLIMPKTITTTTGILQPVDPAWWGRLARVMGDQAIEYDDGCLLSTEKPIAEIVEKVSTREITEAIAVDTESAAVAEVAAVRNVPFLALRVVVDDANQTLPESVLAATDVLGRPRIRVMVSALVFHPELWATIVQINSAYRTAKRTLKVVSGIHPGSLAFDDSPLA